MISKNIKFILLLPVLWTKSAFSIGSAGIDATLVGGYTASYRVHGYALLGSDSLQAGPLLHYSKFAEDVSEIIMGGGVRFGDQFSVFVGGGYVKEQSFALKSEGPVGLVVFRKMLSKIFYLSVPFTYRNIVSGNDKRHELTWLPMLGTWVSF